MPIKFLCWFKAFVFIIYAFVTGYGQLYPFRDVNHAFVRSLKKHLGNGSIINVNDVEGFYFSNQLIWTQRPNTTLKECLDDFRTRGIEVQDICLLETCLSPDDVFELSGLSSDMPDEGVSTMAMILLHLLENKSCFQKMQTSNSIQEHMVTPSSIEIWGYGMLCSSIIALTAFGGVLTLPIVHGVAYKKTLIYMVGLAVGTLAGSSLFFLIPEALEHTEGEMHRHCIVWNCLLMLFAIYFAFIIERVLKIITRWKKVRVSPESVSRWQIEIKCRDPNTKIEPAVKDTCKTEASEQVGNHIDAVAWVIVFGDVLHNFIDGVSVGAAFTENVLAGISVSVAVFCEELPHELGDFAVLLCEGFTKKQAILCNVMSASTIYIGLSVGIFLGQNDTAHNWVFAFAGGMFLYIALADMMPEMCAVGHLEENRKLIGNGPIFLLQNLGMLSGFGIMFILAIYGENMEMAIKKEI